MLIVPLLQGSSTCSSTVAALQERTWGRFVDGSQQQRRDVRQDDVRCGINAESGGNKAYLQIGGEKSCTLNSPSWHVPIVLTEELLAHWVQVLLV